MLPGVFNERPALEPTIENASLCQEFLDARNGHPDMVNGEVIHQLSVTSGYRDGKAAAGDRGSPPLRRCNPCKPEIVDKAKSTNYHGHSVMKRFEDIAAQRFNIAPDQVVDSLTAETIPGWDSMNYLLFITELEEVFHVSFTMDEVLSAKSLGSIRTHLRLKGAPV
jgi:acyl carrier protein